MTKRLKICSCNFIYWKVAECLDLLRGKSDAKSKGLLVHEAQTIDGGGFCPRSRSYISETVQDGALGHKHSKLHMSF